MKEINIENIIYKPYKRGEQSIRTDGIFQTAIANSGIKKPLKEMIESILGETVETLEVSTEKNMLITHKNGKRVRFDLYVAMNKNTYLDIESQNKNWYNVIQRAETNGSALYYNAHEKGEKENGGYPETIKVRVIFFLDFNLFESGPYHEIIRASKVSSGEAVSDDIEYHFIQMPKFFEQVKVIKSTEEQWIAYLSNQLSQKQLERLFKMNENIRDVDKIARELIEDREIMNAIDRIVIKNAEERSARAGMYNHIKKETQRATAKKMLAKEKTLEEIMEFTELSKEEIEKLISQ